MEVKLAIRALAVAGVLFSGLAYGALIPATVAEVAKGDPTISSPVTFNVDAFKLNVPSVPTGFEITLNAAQISFGSPVTPITVFLTNGQLSTANLPFFNGCLSIPPTGTQTQATCIGEGWQVGPADVSGNQLMATFAFSSSKDAMTAQTWANSGTLFVALGGNEADQFATCSPCTGPISNGITVALITADTSVPEPGTIGFVAMGTAAIIALRRRRAPRG